MQLTKSFLFSLFGILLFSLTAQAQDTPTTDQLVQFYQGQLESPFYGDRMDGIAGLGHLGKEASPAIFPLIDLSKNEQNNFYRLLSLWSLAEIGTYEAFDWSQHQGRLEKPQLTKGSFREVAARTVLLATLDRSSETMFDLNKTLPKLYNTARGGDNLTEQLTALWALFQLSTSVTVQTAERAIGPIADELSPEHPNYTRHLRYIRLIGPQAKQYFENQLTQLLQNYDFKIGLTPKRALTAYTLAAISYPDEPAAVTQFKKDINRRLESTLDRSQALDDASALGPFACSSEIVANLKEISKSSGNEDAKTVLSVCE